MRLLWLILLFMLSALSINAQKGFSFPEGVDKIEIPFQSVYNLIILPVEVNGVGMDFILDTGANKSVIFNFNGIDSLNVNPGKTLKISGYGNQEPIDAYYSDNNRININGYANRTASLFITVDQQLNLLPTLGVEVNGLLGKDFFENALVNIDYLNAMITVYKNSSMRRVKRSRRVEAIIELENDKPYINGKVVTAGIIHPVRILIDTGSSDALWVFQDDEDDFMLPEKGFDDFLGIGLNGRVTGRRSKIEKLLLGNIELNKVTVSFPDQDSTTSNNSTQILSGSIGGEILSRFNLSIDYRNKRVQLQPNEEFAAGFFYNMAGIEIRAGDTELFTYYDDGRNDDVNTAYGTLRGQKTVNTSKTVNYKWVPSLFIQSVRKDSPADKAGIKVGDEIVRVNSIAKANLTLNNVASQFFKNPYSRLKIKVKRGEREKKFTLKLVPVID
ncbi:aspartyl protease family protein [Nonlabens ponticola]|nr:aspartyl protease family protein [Nonlabens ponticola]